MNQILMLALLFTGIGFMNGTDFDSLKVYDAQGVYRGNLNGNQFDPNSVNNPAGRYGSSLSQDSINSKFNLFKAPDWEKF